MLIGICEIPSWRTLILDLICVGDTEAGFDLRALVGTRFSDFGTSCAMSDDHDLARPLGNGADVLCVIVSSSVIQTQWMCCGHKNNRHVWRQEGTPNFLHNVWETR